MRTGAGVLLAVLTPAALAGCGSEGPLELNPSQVDEYAITLQVGRDTLHFVGDTVRITTRVLDQEGRPVPNPSITWRSLDGSVRVANGLASAVRQGRADITASVGRSTATLTLVVDQVPAAITRQADTVRTAPRGVVEAPLVLTDSSGSPILHLTDALSWDVAEEVTATVDGRGRVFGRAQGLTTVRASFAGLSADAAVVVGTVAGGGMHRVWSQDGTVLVGELDLPSGQGPFPVMVRVHGSGPTGRLQGTFLTGQVRPAGIGVLRYDKRGVGESEGLYFGVGVANSEHDLGLLAEDASAWLEYLTHHEAIDGDKLGVLGVSQGGWINTIVAGISPHVRYMINVVGPTISVGQQIFYQNLTGSTGQGENFSGLSDSVLFQRVRDFGGPRGYDPAPALRDAVIPGLWVLGDKDYLVPYGPNVEILEAIVDETGADYSVLTLENAYHATRDQATRQFVPWWDVADGGFDWLRARGFMN